jgi:hypothetical protein
LNDESFAAVQESAHGTGPTSNDVRDQGEYWRVSGPAVDAADLVIDGVDFATTLEWAVELSHPKLIEAEAK